MVATIREKAKQTNECPRAIIQAAAATVSAECAANMPSYDALRKLCNRQRDFGPNPSCIRELSVPMELQRTLRDEEFLGFDSGTDDPDRYLLFTTERNLDILERSEVWHADGTFKCSPALFYQLYSIHAVFKEHTLPLVFILLQNKTQEQYIRVLNQLRNLNALLTPREVIVDFEKASINAFKAVFPSVSVKGCFFHFSQANWRKIQDLGLSSIYRDEETVRTTIKSFVSLALIPMMDMDIGFEKLLENLDERLEPFVHYFEDTWMGRVGRLGKKSKPLFEPALWNQFENARDGKQKTNNSVEGWHRAFQMGMGCAHPTICKFIQYLRNEQSLTENRITRIIAGEDVYKRPEYVHRQNRLAKILKDYQNSIILKELEGISYNFEF